MKLQTQFRNTLICNVCKHNKSGCTFGNLKNYKNYKEMLKHIRSCKHIDCRVPPELIIDSFKIKNIKQKLE